jgi:hypothetical protein
MDVRISAERNLGSQQSVGGDGKGMKEREAVKRDVSYNLGREWASGVAFLFVFDLTL